MVFSGCTSLLGDFEVSAIDTSAGDGGGGGDGGGEACTTCNGQCVDLKTNTLNCGACGIACLGGQTCTEGKCVCPSDKAFCNGSCVAATRKACGPTCAECAADQICQDGCKAAPPAAFEVPPRDPTGWKDEGGKPLMIKLRGVGAGTTYECRTGPVGSFVSPTDPPWAPCDGAGGTGLDYLPKEVPATPEGSYRTEMRYRNENFVSDVARVDYYVHHRLDGVATCPRPGKDEGPRFTDQQYFDAAQTWAQSGASGGLFDISTQFPGPASGEMALRNPFLKISFKGVRSMPHMAPPNAGVPAWPALNTVADWEWRGMSLRHRYAINQNRTMVLVRRQYTRPSSTVPAPRGPDCRDLYMIGNELSRNTAPAGIVRGRKTIDCEALVLNVRGQGLCMVKGPNNTPVPLLLDKSIDHQAGVGTGTVGTNNGLQIVPTGVFNPGAYVGQFIQFGPNGKREPWRKITAWSGTAWTVDPPVTAAVPAGTKYIRSGGPFDRYVMPTAYTKLYENSHTDPLRSDTKCVSAPTCDDGVVAQAQMLGIEPWLTYLPP